MYDRILVPLDGSATSDMGLEEAVGLAGKLKARLVLLNVVDDFPLMMEWSTAASFEDSLHRIQEYGKDLLAKAAERARARDVECETLIRDAREQAVANLILQVAKESGCSLIVMGTHGRRGVKRLAMGSDAELVVRSSHVPVLLVRAGDDKAST